MDDSNLEFFIAFMATALEQVATGLVAVVAITGVVSVAIARLVNTRTH